MKTWQRLIASMRDPAMVRDHEGRVVFCNARFAALLARREETLEGARLDELAGAALAPLSESLDFFERGVEDSATRALRLGPFAGEKRRFKAEFLRLAGPPRPATLALLVPAAPTQDGQDERSAGQGLLELVSESLAASGQGLSHEDLLEGARDALDASLTALLDLESERRLTRCLARAELPGEDAGRALRQLLEGGLPAPWIQQLGRGERVALAPEDDATGPTGPTGPRAPQRRFTETLGLRSLLLEPLTRDGKLQGAFIALDLKCDEVWSEDAAFATRLLARTCSHARTLSVAADRRDRLDALMRHCPLGVVHTDEKGTILAVNPAYETMTGSSSAALIGCGFALVEEALRGESRVRALDEALLRGRPWSGRLPRKHEDGTRRELMVNIVPMLDGAGTHEGFLGFVRDLSSDLEMDEGSRRDQKHRAIGRLAAGIAHEINTPAQYVMNNVRFLAETQGALHDALTQLLELQDQARSGSVPEELVASTERGLEEIDLPFLLQEAPGAVVQALEGVEKISTLVGALSRFASPEPGRRDRVNLNESIETTLEVGRFAWSLLAEVETDLAEELPQLSLYASEFNQVMLSLIENASEAIAERRKASGSAELGMIRVASALREGHVEIRVEDDGAGMSHKTRERAFEPQYSTKQGEGGHAEGRGRGLTYAHSVIVDRHAGTISLSERPGGGTVVTLRLPLTPAPQPVAG